MTTKPRHCLSRRPQLPLHRKGIEIICFRVKISRVAITINLACLNAICLFRVAFKDSESSERNESISASSMGDCLLFILSTLSESILAK